MLDWKRPDTWLILIVDDEPDNLELLAVYLQFLGAVVKTAQDGLDGLDALKTFPANLILLDLSMPKYDGWHMKLSLAANETWRGITTIALTAHAMPKDKDRVREAGFDGYLPKPFNLPTLLADLQNAVSVFSTNET